MIDVAEHGTIVHVVAVDHVIAIREILAVHAGQVDSTCQAAVSVEIVGSVIQVVLALQHRIVDMGAVDGQPSSRILVDRSQHAQAHPVQRQFLILDDLGLVLHQVCARGKRGVLRIHSVVKDIAAVEDHR